MNGPYINIPFLREFLWVNCPIRSTGELASIGLHHRIFYSELHNADIGVTIYTPPGYDNSKQYPLIYFLHGAGGCETDEYHVRMAGHLNFLIAESHIPPLIYVFPNGGKGSCFANFHDGSLRIESCIIKELMPWVKSNYSIAPGKCGIEGISMGGNSAFMLAMKHPDIFASAISMPGVLSDMLKPQLTPQSVNNSLCSSVPNAVFGNSVEYIRKYNPLDIAEWNKENIIAEKLKLLITVGDRDNGTPSQIYGGVRVAEDFKKKLDKLNIPNTFFKIPGVYHEHDHYLPLMEQFVKFHLKKQLKSDNNILKQGESNNEY